jgi:DNA-binding NarL/FixJ family response regulator
MTCNAERHGTYHFYRHYGCRCPEAIADRNRLAAGAYVDPVAVERVVDGGQARLGPAERRMAVAQLDAKRLSARQIAERLRVTPRTVTRIRGRLRQQQAA